MRQLAIAAILFLALCAPAQALSAGNAGSAVFDLVTQEKCTKPDSALVKPQTDLSGARTLTKPVTMDSNIERYNGQVKGFNDCLRIYVQIQNNKISLIRAQATKQLDAIKSQALDQIHDIERAINTAIIDVSIVNGGAQATDLPPPATALSAFPAAACNRPDATLLNPPRGKHAASLQGLDRYEMQRRPFQACMGKYIAQAKTEIAAIKTDAEAACKQVTDDANPRIVMINDAVTQALSDAAQASGERDVLVNSKSFALPPPSLPPPHIETAPQALLPDAENVTVTGERFPQSADMPTGAGDPDAISCRAPQQLADSRLKGPEICKHNRDWAKLTREGFNISPDGTRLVGGEKYLSLHPQTCITHNTVSASGLAQVDTFCNQGDRF